MRGLDIDMFGSLLTEGQEYIFAIVDPNNGCIVFHGSELGKRFLKKRLDFLESLWLFCKNEASKTENLYYTNLCQTVKLKEADMGNKTSDGILKDNSSNSYKTHVGKGWCCLKKNFHDCSRDDNHQQLSPENISNNSEAIQNLCTGKEKGKDHFELPNSRVTCVLLDEGISVKNPKTIHPEHTSVCFDDTTENQIIIHTEIPSTLKKQPEYIADMSEHLGEHISDMPEKITQQSSLNGILENLVECNSSVTRSDKELQHSFSNQMLKTFSPQNSSKETIEKLAILNSINESPEILEKQNYSNETSKNLAQDTSSIETLDKSIMIRWQNRGPSKPIKSVFEEECESSNDNLENVAQHNVSNHATENSVLIKRRRQRSSPASSGQRSSSVSFVKSVVSELSCPLDASEEHHKSSNDIPQNSCMIKNRRVRPNKSRSTTSPSLKQQQNSTKYATESRKKEQPKSSTCISLFSKLQSDTSKSVNKIPQCLSNEEEMYDDCFNIKDEVNCASVKSDQTSKTAMKCNICQKVFKSKTRYISHSERKFCMQVFKCDECGNLFKHAGNLETHIKTKHRKLVTVICQHCGKLFRCNKNLNQHVKYAHSKTMKFKCHICQKEIHSKCNFERHLNTHKTEFKWMCEECGKYYSSRDILNRHLRIHREDKKFVCEVCSRAFVQCHGLTRHMRTHTGQKPYCCQLCPATFAHNVSLKTHMRNSHSS